MSRAFSVRRFTLGVIAALGLLAPAFGASDYLLEIDGVQGESRLVPGAIDIQAFSYDVKSPRDSASGLATGKRAGRVNMSDISVSKQLDKSTPLLFKACAEGKHFPKATLTCRKAGDDKQQYLVVTMSDVLISSYSTTGDSNDNVPMENISLNFSHVDFTFTFSPGDGSVSEPITFGWDLATGKK